MQKLFQLLGAIQEVGDVLHSVLTESKPKIISFKLL